MATVSFFTPQYYANPQTFSEKVHNFVENYFDLTNASALETALKIISYATLIIPAIVLAMKVYFRFCAAPKPITLSDIVIPPEILAVLDHAPQFRGYLIGAPGSGLEGTNLTSATVRPANLFYTALLGEDATTMPGSGQLFAFTGNPADIREHIANLGDQITVTADGTCRVHGHEGEIPLVQLYGNGQFRMSGDEVCSILDSQKIYTAPLLDRHFYYILKRALIRDGIVTLPSHDGAPVKLRDLNTPRCQQLIADIQSTVARDRVGHLLDLTLYQLGSLVVKTEDYYLLTNPDGTLRERQPGERDTIRLINACGIRGVHATPEGAITHRTIMTQGFRTALIAAERGHVVFPAVGMGVWGGDPNLYWRAFLDAVVDAPEALEKIFINPRHQATPRGLYAGQNGAEFQTIFNEYRANNANNPAALANLNKIINLYDRQTDVLHLSHQLKVAFPDKTISLFNASDPDVTLGNHVGEYVNNLNHPPTTEENYTAIGTNGICFESITGIHENAERPNERIIQT